MEINEKLAHLSDDEIDEVIELYQDKSIKVQEIIDTYHIDVKVNELIRILPPINSKHICPYCNEPMLYHIQSRSNTEPSEFFCGICGHRMWSPERKYYIKTECTCKNCENAKRTLLESKIRQIQDAYPKYEKTPFSSIDVADRLLLYELMLHNEQHSANQLTYNTITQHRENIDLLQKTLCQLRDKRIISVSSQSPLSAFVDDENFPNTYYTFKVTYDINVDFNVDELYKLNTFSYFSEAIPIKAQLTILHDRIWRDALKKFEIELNKRNLELIVTEDALDKYKSLVNKISYTQLLNFGFKVAVFFSDKVITGEIPAYIANNAVLKNVYKFYERSINEGWEIRHSEYEFAGSDLTFWINNIMGKKLSLLKTVACEANYPFWEDIDEIQSHEISYKRDTN